jgi:hypothetical protein
MRTVELPDGLEAAAVMVARRAGQSVDEYVAAAFAHALSVEMDHARLNSSLSGTLGGGMITRGRGWPISPQEGAANVRADLAS